MDRTKRYVQFGFSDGVVERPYDHDTRSKYPKLIRSARKCIAPERTVKDSGWRQKTKEDQHTVYFILGRVTTCNDAPLARKAIRTSDRFYIDGTVVPKALVSHTKKVIEGVTES